MQRTKVSVKVGVRKTSLSCDVTETSKPSYVQIILPRVRLQCFPKYIWSECRCRILNLKNSLSIT